MALFSKLKRSSFDPARLKARLKMAQTRMNILKNKTQNSIKVQKRQVATLLNEQKDESARIKVESIIRDDYLLEAIDILQLFCDLLITRINLIAESKTCPHDMKEAISTLIYVAPRINVDELMQIRDMFQSKFGKEFVSKAMENKDLAVNQRVKFKLGIKVPKPYLCIQYLKKIAEEFNIEWEDEDEEEVPQDVARDQLNNPEMDYPSNTEGTGYNVDFNPNTNYNPQQQNISQPAFNPQQQNVNQPAFNPQQQQNHSGSTQVDGYIPQNNFGSPSSGGGGQPSMGGGPPVYNQQQNPGNFGPGPQQKALQQKRQNTGVTPTSDFDLQQQQFNQMFNSENVSPPMDPQPNNNGMTSSQMEVEDDLQRRLRELSESDASFGGQEQNNNNGDNMSGGNMQPPQPSSTTSPNEEDLSYDFNELQKRFEMLKKRD